KKRPCSVWFGFEETGTDSSPKRLCITHRHKNAGTQTRLRNWWRAIIRVSWTDRNSIVIERQNKRGCAKNCGGIVEQILGSSGKLSFRRNRAALARRDRCDRFTTHLERNDVAADQQCGSARDSFR